MFAVNWSGQEYIVNFLFLCLDILFCRECTYQLNVSELSCDSCGLPSDCFQQYWFGFKRQEIPDLLEWFQNHPSSSTCYFGAIVCSICDVISFSFKSTSFEEWSSNLSYTSTHNHGSRVYSFQCIVMNYCESHLKMRSCVTKNTVERIKDCIVYEKPAVYVLSILFYYF